MPHQNERVELAIQILEYRRRLRHTIWDDATLQKMQAELAQLEKKLREIDE